MWPTLDIADKAAEFETDLMRRSEAVTLRDLMVAVTGWLEGRSCGRGTGGTMREGPDDGIVTEA